MRAFVFLFFADVILDGRDRFAINARCILAASMVSVTNHGNVCAMKAGVVSSVTRISTTVQIISPAGTTAPASILDKALTPARVRLVSLVQTVKNHF